MLISWLVGPVLSAGELAILVPVEDIEGFLGVLDGIRVVMVQAVVVLTLVFEEFFECDQSVVIVVHVGEGIPRGRGAQPFILIELSILVGIQFFIVTPVTMMIAIDYTFLAIMGLFVLGKSEELIAVLVRNVEIVPCHSACMSWGCIVKELARIDFTVFIKVKCRGGLIVASEVLGNLCTVVLVLVVCVEISELLSIEKIIFVGVTLSEKVLWRFMRVHVALWLPYSVSSCDQQRKANQSLHFGSLSTSKMIRGEGS